MSTEPTPTHTSQRCGCIVTTWTDHGPEIEHCPLHAAAPKLLKALKDLLAWSQSEYQSDPETDAAAVQAIALAERL